MFDRRVEESPDGRDRQDHRKDGKRRSMTTRLVIVDKRQPRVGWRDEKAQVWLEEEHAGKLGADYGGTTIEEVELEGPAST